MTTRLYWAYGSNLNRDGMRRRCPAAKRVGPLTLSDGALVFRGVADVVSRENSLIPGGVWRVTPECEQALDRYEGWRPDNNGLYRKKYLELSIDGKRERAFYYQMTLHHREIMPPSEAYLDVIREGYEWFGLDLSILNRALEESWSEKKVTPRLRARHIRRGRPKLAQLEE